METPKKNKCPWIPEPEFKELENSIWNDINQEHREPKPLSWKQDKQLEKEVMQPNQDKKKIKKLQNRIRELEASIQQLEREHCPPGGLCDNEVCISCGSCEIYQAGEW